MKQQKSVKQRHTEHNQAASNPASSPSRRSGAPSASTHRPRAGGQSRVVSDGADTSGISPNRRRARPQTRAEQLLLFGAGARDTSSDGRQRPKTRQRTADATSSGRSVRAKAPAPRRLVDQLEEVKATVAVDAATCSPHRAQRLARQLQSLIELPLRLQIHDNRSTMVSFRRETTVLHLRVHHMFVDADPEVLQAIADYSRARDRGAGTVLDRYVRANRDRIRPMDLGRLRSRPLRTEGEAHDLADIYDSLNARYFGGGVDARIGWGRGSTARRRRSIRMGAYYHDTRTILIHPALDREEVPRFFVEFVVYHEMLHQAVPQYRTPSGRRCVHTPEFRAREKLFHDYQRARAWEDRNLGLLLRPKSSRSRSGSR